MKLIMFMVAVLISASAHASECASKLNLDTPDFYPNIIHCLQELEKENKQLIEAQKVGVNPINFGLVNYPFSNINQWAQIPGSEGAIFCGLTFVDDDTALGSCEIGRDSGNHWIVRTGGSGEDNACAATCLMAK